MTRILALMTALMLFATPAGAQSREIEGVIADQFEKFRADDFAGAFDHASPMIQGIFGSAENFGMMVRNGYPMVHRPKVFRFLDLKDAAPEMQQIVEVEDMDGRSFLLRYDMIETENGWKINGVQILPPPDVAA
ncbi:hypothetical protein ATO6_01030 [Oceanicola sp. 22II-s10i]|uniref:DUF4864 domain-containing protein n=1 Tax=Oceanicola sp. 22II-s10i TaxID=1317116 RepID=UPI000B52569D|nr:DUF4864 domain-containing protein [Oceanicola sp. 22II-s10i]OWU85557.1 hypothetical protein ATO6_01030 [Oceanicola sp. 22II-s10i]